MSRSESNWPILLGGGVCTVLGGVLFATTNDRNASIVESTKPTTMADLRKQLSTTPTGADGKPTAKYALVQGICEQNAELLQVSTKFAQ